MSHKSRYTRDDRKHIVESIENLKNDQDYVAIFEILTSDDNILYTPNSNGVFLNLSAVGDTTLSQIRRYLRKAIRKNKQQEAEQDIDIIPNCMTPNNDRAYKLSNYEKNIIKQRNLKKVMNDDNDYEELKLSSKPLAKKSKSKQQSC